MDNRRLLPIIIISVIALIVVIGLSSSIFYTLSPGERGVLFKKFGGGLDKENVYEPGFHMKAPWNELIKYDVTEQTSEETMDVIDKNGLSINIDVSVRFRPVYDSIGALYENFRNGYSEKLVKQEVRSSVRRITGKYVAEEIYSTKRSEVELAIKQDIEDVLKMNNVEMRALVIRSIKLPEQLKAAIETKLQQEQEALAYQFRLDKEKSEAERKKIAAEGEAQANKIVNSSLTPNLLKMRGIEATLKLAESQNSKVVVIGQGEGGLPLILGNN
ncbi:MAG: prohibitin family protein [Roseivirga sp.]|jgi:regulator of protease activity HflC (stomatin/prohibitin superfamily)|uniref:prohibitin family protein n=1 Tax=Roseivirga sp. TaxID=1964215 RepID=UPI001B1F479C|nr:prohibitin family protein [Roseivirga sp.]MBO6660006.1 prohibitin family protein [Roseivirga sp.]MBO6907257.1 prohibitin family protein [Roseivirga sp.]